MMLEGESSWGLCFPLCLFLPGTVVFLFFFYFSLPGCSSVLMLSLRVYHGQEHTAWQSGEKTQGFPLYLCSQQGITLLLCPGSKPFAAGSSSQDGSSLQGRGIFLLPPPQQVCVQASLFMPAHFMCFAVGSHRLLQGRMSPSATLTKAATVWKYNHLSSCLPLYYLVWWNIVSYEVYIFLMALRILISFLYLLLLIELLFWISLEYDLLLTKRVLFRKSATGKKGYLKPKCKYIYNTLNEKKSTNCI